MISNERLAELIEVDEENVKWADEHPTWDTGDFARDGLAAFRELAQYRRTFAKIEEMLKADDDMTLALSFNNPPGKFVADFDDEIGGSVQVRYAEADSPFAALSALAESVSKGAGQ